MVDLNDEVLGAFIDDELDAQTRAIVAARAAADPAVRARIEELRAADALLREAFPLQAPTQAQIAAVEGRVGEVVKFPQRSVQSWQAVVAVAIAAAGVTLFAAGPTLHTLTAQPAADHAAGAFAAALESQASGANVDGVKIVVSLKTADGRYCREFERSSATGAQHGLACRSSNGWAVVALASTPTRGPGFQAAGAASSIDATIDALAATPIDPANEAVLANSGWRTRP